MDLLKYYCMSCINACSPEKYVIDQNEIEFPSTNKTEFSPKIWDFYYSTSGNYTMYDRQLHSLDTEINENKYFRRNNNSQNLKNLEKVKVIQDFFLDNETESNSMNKNMYNVQNSESLKGDKECNIYSINSFNKTANIFIENIFDIAIAPEKEVTSNKKKKRKKAKKKVTN
ncbi:hypothetical protein, variant 3 [Plasmodium yoelii 17X]|nr:conserved Plasmodium protein, unknown function [Plasmodium yoelii]ETB61018.1 hypothetical protein YYC_01967 [Plasmodium yoelii 17X]ETB61019.1 hypothetical protein, variant 1 [Plasmodium yoelii 17X]ETB61020.1 hypothetical protein, variant 2 [Plasmodium yoelii 17X]ETB61021.1 hypothetical protein, variant 3 [Plasmodium yoelii 17X]CDU19060.1 conserved Plasmodium protein, unknown function [Plasmodium yoelii]|eukprot:XP_724839.2 conserved Plasmodium protein, unknown function [Plasmodium yoelii]